MSLIYVTGIAGSGKSAVLQELLSRGYEAFGTDEDGIAAFYDNHTNEKLTNPPETAAGRTPEWRSRYTYKMAKDEVRQLATHTTDDPVFLCGVAANENEVWDLFSKVLALVIDDNTLERRIATRTGNNFGQVPHELTSILEWQAVAVETYKNRGVTMIDATRPIAEVVDDVVQVATVDEVESRGPAHATAETVVERVRQLREGGSKTLLVAIDGPGGAGKSTLAHQIADNIESVTVVCLDDFSRPSVPGWDQGRFCDQVLNPLLSGRPGRYQRWDWDRDEAAEWHDVPSGGTVIVEGVSSTRTELGTPWDLTIWVDAPENVRLERGIERDGEKLRSMWVELWIPGENAYMAEQQPQERADLFVDGTGAV